MQYWKQGRELNPAFPAVWGDLTWLQYSQVTQQCLWGDKDCVWVFWAWPPFGATAYQKHRIRSSTSDLEFHPIDGILSANLMLVWGKKCFPGLPYSLTLHNLHVPVERILFSEPLYTCVRFQGRGCMFFSFLFKFCLVRLIFKVYFVPKSL